MSIFFPPADDTSLLLRSPSSFPFLSSCILCFITLSGLPVISYTSQPPERAALNPSPSKTCDPVFRTPRLHGRAAGRLRCCIDRSSRTRRTAVHGNTLNSFRTDWVLRKGEREAEKERRKQTQIEKREARERVNTSWCVCILGGPSLRG